MTCKLVVVYNASSSLALLALALLLKLELMQRNGFVGNELRGGGL